MATVKVGGRDYNVEVRGDKVVVDGHEYDIKVREEPAFATVTAGGVQYRVQLPAPVERTSGMAKLCSVVSTTRPMPPGAQDPPSASSISTMRRSACT